MIIVTDISVFQYQQLPEQKPIHWNAQGQPNAMHIEHLVLLDCPKLTTHSRAIQTLIVWILPVLSLILIPVILLILIGYYLPIYIITPPVAAGVILIVIGNYLPKSRKNYVFGIKLPWTLSYTDKWYKTHRLTGYLWIVGAFL